MTPCALANHEVTPPETLFKYYAPGIIEDTINGDTLKWEIPCDENDPFEALANGWDEEVVSQEIGKNPELDKALLDDLFKSRNLQDKISLVAAFVSFAKRGDNILMWAHYADKHKGACIAFDKAIIEKEIDVLEQVDYAKEEKAKRKKIPLPHNGQDDFSEEYQRQVRRFLSYKAKEWSYEEEWRLIIPPMAKCITPLKLGQGNSNILVSKIPKDSIRKLIFGYRMPVSKRLSLAKRIIVNHPNCKFAEIVPDKDRFELHIEPLDIGTVTQECNVEVE